MSDKTTLDELIEEFSARAIAHSNSISTGRDPYNRGVAEGLMTGYERAAQHIKEHRPALIAGMRPVLRWLYLPSINEYELLKADGTRMASDLGIKRYCTRKDCEQFSNNIGLIAEFVEDTNEN